MAALSVLADLRREEGIVVTVQDERAWVRWEPGRALVLERVLPVRGVELYAWRDGHWYRPGDHLPAFGVPEVCEASTVSLGRALVPLPVQVGSPDGCPIAPVRLALVRDGRIRPTSAARCTLSTLAAWAETATSAQLSALSAARAGDVVLLLGSSVPALSGSERFWGGRVLVPLGFRIDPELSEHALRDALGIGAESIAVFDAEGVEVIASAVFRPLKRADVRLAAQEAER
jgi:hypothetical protein